MRTNIRKPGWLKVKRTFGENYRKLKSILAESNLHTVCEEAGCPNICECFEQKTATFLILGDVCTRNCKFCDIKKGVPEPVDPDEPKRLAGIVKRLDLEYVVITSVTRDDLPSGGAEVFAQCIKKVKELNPQSKIEVLIPDFSGSFKALKKVLKAKPEVLNHNLETIKRLYPSVRPKANYELSLDILKRTKKENLEIITKSGIMLGLGESWEEIIQAMKDLKDSLCSLLTIGQYLKPKSSTYEVRKYYHPDEFLELKEIGKKMGFSAVESNPLVRSSYRAKLQFKDTLKE
ncbi:MAG: lipoyl synthase [candidate division Zixibacteria bacterium SM23_73_2]|nr:MAG: lipoyl synthase [candidate division Zixibacteria bacterium SM23_73_2]